MKKRNIHKDAERNRFSSHGGAKEEAPGYPRQPTSNTSNAGFKHSLRQLVCPMSSYGLVYSVQKKSAYKPGGPPGWHLTPVSVA